MMRLVKFLSFICLFLAGYVASQESVKLTLSDMRLTADQQTTTKLRNAYIRTNKWANGIVPYTFHSAIANDARRKSAIENAIKIYNTSTCIRWVPRTTQKEYVQFMDGGDSQCYSYVGKINLVPQPISIGKGCENALGVIIHEMMHTMGFLHEHMRPDRDQHINVITAKIEQDYLNQFTKVNPTDVNEQNLGYDYGSVMHYPSTAFSKDGSRTIVTIDPTAQSRIGQRSGFSKCDLEKLNKWYGCTNYIKNDPSCTMKPSNPVITTECKDDLPSTKCPMDKANCAHYPGKYMKLCKKTCGNCDGTKCADTDQNGLSTMCQSVTKNSCDTFEQIICPKSCGTC